MPNDKALALERIRQLEADILALGPEFNMALNQSSESWHDNAPFDALREKQDVMVAELQTLKGVINRALPSVPHQNKRKVGVGSVVTTEDMQSGRQHVYHIAGDWTMRAGHEENGALIISTKSPVALQLLDKRIGDEFHFRRDFKIIAIDWL